MQDGNESTGAAEWAEVYEEIQALREEIAGAIVGQERVIEEMLITLLCGGHGLIVGVPGLAKTLLVSTLATCLGGTFRRIQFTPDLMPADITGSEILQPDSDGARRFEFARGPVFANFILADEINRTPPKTQSALLEAMQENQVTVAGRSMPLPRPFHVFATQNPIEHEGTYPLPEAQLDRFFFQIVIDYPSMAEERDIVLRTAGKPLPETRPVLSVGDTAVLQQRVADVPVPDHVLDSILRLVHGSRPRSESADDYVKRYVEWGAGPRASQTLTMASKALALLRRQPAASLEEVRAVAHPALRHRIIPSYNATGENVEVEAIVDHLLATAF